MVSCWPPLVTSIRNLALVIFTIAVCRAAWIALTGYFGVPWETEPCSWRWKMMYTISTGPP